jgi:phage gp36-like protein
MAYSEIKAIRKEAGFHRNTNIPDSQVTLHQTTATGIINSKLSSKYKLPLNTSPAILERIERLIAGGYLMLEEYGVAAEGTGKDGQAKVNQGMDLLGMILSGEIPLIDETFADLEKNDKSTMRGYPDYSDEPIFTKDMVF